MSADRQTIQQLRAEIEFRAKLARQHVTGEMLLPDYFGKDEHDRILLERIEATRRDMRELTARGVALSPFLELGAERGQRSLVVANDFLASGVATDISFHQLRAMEHFAELFGLPRLPLRVCCDANHLPFRSSAFRFVFCYQFLHHFPSLPPVLGEIGRVMRTGWFRFGEEPYRRVLKLALYRQVTTAYAPGTRRRNRYRRFLESFVSLERSEEVEHGILENDDIGLDEWVAALAAFPRWEAQVESPYGFRSSLGPRLSVRNRVNWLLGGEIDGLCRIDGDGWPTDREAPSVDVEELLACPACRIEADAGDPDRVPVRREGESYRCVACGFAYPVRDGVIFLIPPAELRELYPELDA